MNLLLTSSRNPSLRVRQFIKSFSLIFPKSIVKVVNRGKMSLGEVFTSYSSFQVVFIVTNNHGNPNSIIGYIKNSKNQFAWKIEFKIKSIKLHYELQIDEAKNPDQIFVQFVEIDNELQIILDTIFNKIIKMNNDRGTKIKSNTKCYLTLENNHPGFKVLCQDEENQIRSPLIYLSEIRVEDLTGHD